MKSNYSNLFALAFLFGSPLAVINAVSVEPVQAATPVVKTEWDSRLNDVQPTSNGIILWVDIKKQRLSVFEKAPGQAKGKFITSYQILTGKNSKPTPTGVFYTNSNRQISSKTDIKLTGSYGTALVSVWIPFIDNMIAFHDAPWRAQWEFGNKKQQEIKGSSGCINMDSQDVRHFWKYLFETKRPGTRSTAVIVTNG
ncbi:MAG: L,D-transpeptidase [Patescibacteria group bacterium]